MRCHGTQDQKFIHSSSDNYAQAVITPDAKSLDLGRVICALILVIIEHNSPPVKLSYNILNGLMTKSSYIVFAWMARVVRP